MTVDATLASSGRCCVMDELLSSYLEQLVSDDVSISQAVHQGEGVVYGHGDVGAQLSQPSAKVGGPINLNPGHVTLTLCVDI